MRGDKLIQDKRGKAMRAYKAEKLAKGKISTKLNAKVEPSKEKLVIFIFIFRTRKLIVTFKKPWRFIEYDWYNTQVIVSKMFP